MVDELPGKSLKIIKFIPKKKFLKTYLHWFETFFFNLSICESYKIHKILSPEIKKNKFIRWKKVHFVLILWCYMLFEYYMQDKYYTPDHIYLLTSVIILQMFEHNKILLWTLNFTLEILGVWTNSLKVLFLAPNLW